MKTINTILRDRILAEAEEAEIQGLVKIASSLTDQLELNKVRDVSENYKYSSSEFEKDVQNSLWNIIIRTADFHNASFKSDEAQEIVDFYSKEILKEIRSSMRIPHKVGSYEEPVPGEEQVLIEITD